MLTVWVMALMTSGGMLGNSITIDNIASKEECQRVGQEMLDQARAGNKGNQYYFQCHSVEKVRV